MTVFYVQSSALLLKQWYNIADDMTEYLINDRLCFQRFLGSNLGDKVPDAQTIWLFREKLKASKNETKPAKVNQEKIHKIVKLFLDSR